METTTWFEFTCTMHGMQSP